MQKDLFFQRELFNSTLAEIEISYRPKYKASELPKVVTLGDAYGVLRFSFIDRQTQLDTETDGDSYAVFYKELVLRENHKRE